MKFRRLLWAENKSMDSGSSWHPSLWSKKKKKEKSQKGPLAQPERTSGESFLFRFGKRETSLLVGTAVAGRTRNVRNSEGREPFSGTRAAVSRGRGKFLLLYFLCPSTFCLGRRCSC